MTNNTANDDSSRGHFRNQFQLKLEPLILILYRWGWAISGSETMLLDTWKRTAQWNNALIELTTRIWAVLQDNIGNIAEMFPKWVDEILARVGVPWTHVTVAAQKTATGRCCPRCSDRAGGIGWLSAMMKEWSPSPRIIRQVDLLACSTPSSTPTRATTATGTNSLVFSILIPSLPSVHFFFFFSQILFWERERGR